MQIFYKWEDLLGFDLNKADATQQAVKKALHDTGIGLMGEDLDHLKDHG